MLRLLFAVLLAGPGVAAQKALHVERFHADVTVREDSVLEVQETLRVRFDGAWNGLLRWFRTEVRTSFGETASLQFEFDSATDGEGRALETVVERFDSGVRFRIEVPGAVDATREVVLRYSVLGAVVHAAAAGQDEIYWDVTGPGWASGIGEASCAVTLPEDVTPDDLRVRVASASDHEAGAVQVEVEGRTIRARATGPLAAGETLIVSLPVPTGLFELPGAFTRISWRLRTEPWIALPIVLLAFLFGVWFALGRDARVELAPEEADGRLPDDLSPAEIGMLADDRLHPRDFAAQIAWCGDRGLLRAERIEGGHWVFERPDGAAQPPDPVDRALIDVLFGDTERVSTADLATGLLGRLDRFREAVEGRLRARGFYRYPPASARRLGTVLILVLVAILIAVGVATRASGVYVIAAFLSVMVAAPLLWHLPSRTRRGARALAQVRAFERRARRDGASLEARERAAAYALGIRTDGDETPEWIADPAGEAVTTPLFLGGIMVLLVAGPRSAGASGGWAGGMTGGGFGAGGGGFGGGGGGGW